MQPFRDRFTNNENCLETDRSLVAELSAISVQPVVVRFLSATDRRSVANQSPIGRRPLKPLHDLNQSRSVFCACKGVLTPTLQPVRDLKKLKSRSGCKDRGKVFLKLPTSCQLKSVASCLLNMHKRLAMTEFDREEVA